MTVEEVMTVEEWKRKNPPIQRKPQTNADRIRAMSDEELAEMIETISSCELCPVDEGNLTWLDWLKQEVEK